MKKLISRLIIAALCIQLCTAAAFAAEVDAAPTGVCAVVSDADGNTSVEDADAVEELEEYQSYELYVNQQTVLSVEAIGGDLLETGVAIPAFYQAEFMIPDTQIQIFLTGLKADHVEELQEAIIDCFTSGVTFDLSDLSFIDTEKTDQSDGDEYLCWAAASSNMLYYSGWGAKAGFTDEDDLFDLFASSFTDEGSHQENGIAWFFNGASLKNNNYPSNVAQILNYPNSGKYFRDYAYDMVSGYEMLRSTVTVNNMFTRLRQGDAVSLGIDLQRNGTAYGSHAITMWGTAVDLSKDVDDPERYHGIFICDSDSHMAADGDRRSAENVLSYFPLYVNQFNRFAFHYFDDVTAALSDYEYLIPYSSSVPRETNLSTPRDKTKYADLVIGEAYLSDYQYDYSVNTLFESGSNLYFSYAVAGAADKAWRSNIKTNCRIVDSNGKVLTDNTDTISLSIFSPLYYTQSTDLRIEGLSNVPAGDYTLTFTVNPSHDPMEAYYYNNTRSIEFKVRDSYILGDYDNNGDVEIVDATKIQRALVGLTTQSDSKAIERGDVNMDDDLEVIDVTWLQRYLAAMRVTYPIGEKALYQEV